MKLLLFPAAAWQVGKSNYCSHQTSVEKSAKVSNLEEQEAWRHRRSARCDWRWTGFYAQVPSCTSGELGGWAVSLAHLTRGRKAVRSGPVDGAHSPVRANSPPVRKGLQWLSSGSVPRQEPLRFRFRFVFFKLKKIDIRQYYNMNQSRSFFIFSMTSNSLFYPQSCFK